MTIYDDARTGEISAFTGNSIDLFGLLALQSALPAGISIGAAIAVEADLVSWPLFGFGVEGTTGIFIDANGNQTDFLAGALFADISTFPSPVEVSFELFFSNGNFDDFDGAATALEIGLFGGVGISVPTQELGQIPALIANLTASSNSLSELVENFLAEAPDGSAIYPSVGTWGVGLEQQFTIETPNFNAFINSIGEALGPGMLMPTAYHAFQCFPAGTLIQLWNGSIKPIEAITQVDIVLTHDAAGKPEPGVVDKLFTNATQEFVRLEFGDGREPLVATPGHRFLTETGDYMEIGHMLRLGGGTARIVDVDGSIVEATGELLVYSAETAHLFPEAQTKAISMQGNTVLKEQVEAGWQTYNFEVREHHNYVAGGVRVHNDSILSHLEAGDQLLALNDDLTHAAVLRDVGNDAFDAPDGDMDVVVLEGFRDPDSGVFDTQIEVLNLYRDDGESYSLYSGGTGSLAEAVNDVFAQGFASTAAGSVTSEGGPDEWNTGSVTDDFEELLFDDVAGVLGDEPTPRAAVRALYDESVAYIDGVAISVPDMPDFGALTGLALLTAATDFISDAKTFADVFNVAFATGVISYELSDGDVTRDLAGANKLNAAGFLLGTKGLSIEVGGDTIIDEQKVLDAIAPHLVNQSEFIVNFGAGIASGYDATGTTQTWDGDVTWEEAGHDLLLRIANGDATAEWLTIEDVYADGGHDEIKSVRFADGAEISLAQLGKTIREGFDGTENADVIVGNDLDNTIRGFRGDDILFGRGGNDTIEGGLHDDYIEGNTGDDIIDGWQGSDTIYGNRGNDTISGGGAKDLIFGGADNDTIDGGEWKDQINGGRGNDTLTGGSDTGVSDIFVFAHDSLDGNDTITDFEVGFDKLILGDSANGFLDISDVTVSGSANAIVSYGSTNITLTGVSASTVTSNASQIFGDDSDFLF